MQKLNQRYINSVVKKALDEDLKPRGDITTNLISLKNKKSKAKIIAKQNGVIAGLEFCKAAFKLIGKEATFKAKIKDGKKIKGTDKNLGGTMRLGSYDAKLKENSQIRKIYKSIIDN